MMLRRSLYMSFKCEFFNGEPISMRSKPPNHVYRFPTVDFHMNTQRLAVGTSEGAIIMFDLKTATRLYVLENHRQRLAACSFSPDGRRLITVSLDENVVLVWKVGSSLSSFFNPGAPPRQGHGDGEPYKTWEFNVGDAGEKVVLLLPHDFAC